MSFSWTLVIGYLCILVFFRNNISLAFLPHSLPGSPEVSALRTCILLVAAGAVGDWTNCTLAGALQGAGKQNVGAAIYAGTHWILGTTLLYIFGFKLGWGVRGIWAALAVVSNVQCFFMSVRPAWLLLSKAQS